MLTLLPDAQLAESEGIRYLSFPSLQSAFVNPTIALDTDFLLLGVDPSELGQSLQASKAGESLEKSPVFSSALPAFKTANEVFGFADARLLFERGFPLLRQVIVFGAAVVPGASDVIDASKLPETGSIAKHLQPIVYSQTRIPEGYLSNHWPDYDGSGGPARRPRGRMVPQAGRRGAVTPRRESTRFALQVYLQSCVCRSIIVMKSSLWIVTATALLIVLAACQSGSQTSAAPQSSGQNRFGYQGTQSAQTQFAKATPTPEPGSEPTPEATPQDTAPSPTPETTTSTPARDIPTALRFPGSPVS